jgi:hypothetical protein
VEVKPTNVDVGYGALTVNWSPVESSVLVTPDGQRIISYAGGDDYTVRIWDFDQRERTAAL